MTLETYRTDAVLKRKSWTPKCAGSTGGRRKTGARPGARSMKKLIFLLNNCDVPMRGFLTVTMAKAVCDRNPVQTHYAFFKAAIKRLKYQGFSPFVWVKEFQKNGSIHWHVFTQKGVGAPGEINMPMTNDWSRWAVNYYRKHWIDERSEKYMLVGNGKDFFGACRWEELASEAGGMYAGKEAGKRYQKDAPERFAMQGGHWWRAVGKIDCTPTGTKTVPVTSLHTVKCKIGGSEQVIATKLQFNRGSAFDV